MIAAKVLERIGKRLPEKTVGIVSSFVPSLPNWEECDQLAMFSVRAVVQRRPEPVLPRCEEWVRSDEKWTRRFAVAVLTSLPKDASYSPGEREFAILEHAMEDEAREVQDTATWALRGIGSRHPAAVIGFLTRCVPTLSRPTKRIVRQTLKALPEDDRNRMQALLNRRPNA